MLSRFRLLLILLSTGLLASLGCSGYTALEPGSTAPTFEVEGWLGDVVPDVENKVVVLEAFATW